VPFSESVDAYRAIDESPHQSIKLGIRFTDRNNGSCNMPGEKAGIHCR